MDSTKPEWANTPLNKQTVKAGAYYSLCILGEQQNPWVQNWFLNSNMVNGVADVSDQTFFTLQLSVTTVFETQPIPASLGDQ